jgi:protein-arginine kinase activator protein McsA
LKQCALDHHVEFCFECDEYPCEKLQTFKNDDNPHHSVVLRNLDHLKEVGSEKWLDEQKKRWSCPQCGTPFSWYDRECEACGPQLYNAVEEDRDIK